MRSLWGRLAAGGALLLIVCTPALAIGADDWSEPYPGVEYLERTTATPNRIRVLKIDLTRKDLRIRATRSDERGRTTSSFAQLRGCEMAVNADFYSGGYDPSGLAVGQWDAWPDGTDSTSSGFVAVGVDNRVEISDLPELVNPPEAWMSDAVGAKPMLIVNGQKLDHNCGSFCNRNPRTAAGLTEDGQTLILAVVDGRSPGSSVGMSLNELSNLMAEMGAHRAINLDGGGSSTMYVAAAGGVVNVPSDGSQRVVSNHLAVCVVEPFGSLTGFVREGDIYDAEASLAGAEVTLSTGQTATTDAEGRYRFEEIPAGEVTIRASTPGLIGERTVYVAADDLTWGSVPLAPMPDAGVPEMPAGPDAGVGGEPPMDEEMPEGGGGCAAAASGGESAPAIALFFAVFLLGRRRRAPRPWPAR